MLGNHHQRRGQGCSAAGGVGARFFSLQRLQGNSSGKMFRTLMIFLYFAGSLRDEKMVGVGDVGLEGVYAGDTRFA